VTFFYKPVKKTHLISVSLVTSKSRNIRIEDITDENDENNQNNESNESDKDKSSKGSNSYTCNTMLKQMSRKEQPSNDESKDKKHSIIKTRKRKCKLISCNIFTRIIFLLICLELK